jgi:hypothetical protein
LSGKITVKSKAYSEIPYYAEQGIFSAVTGKEIRLNSEFLPKTAKPSDRSRSDIRHSISVIRTAAPAPQLPFRTSVGARRSNGLLGRF